MGAVSWKSRLCMIGIVYSSLGCLICEYRQDCTAPNKVSCRQSKNYDLQSVCSTCSTCKNVQYMCRTFSVAVSVAVMLLKKGSVERFCKTKIRTKFRDSPCENASRSKIKINNNKMCTNFCTNFAFCTFNVID